MTVADVELTIQRHESVAARSPRPADRHRSVVILGQATETNCALVAALAEQGQRAWLAQAATSPRLGRGALAIARLDVLPTLDGIEPGLWRLPRLERQGVQLLNSPLALFAAHDKLSTALLLARARVAHPQTAHVREVSVPTFPPPYVVKPRFGSWGRDVYRCRDEDELRARLERLRRRRWFRRQGALVQSLVEPTDRDLRLVVAGGRVVGAVERRALPGEWRTNVALGALRARVSAPPAARALALRAVAALGLDLAGVDIASDATGRSYVLEVNGAVDFNAVYADDVFATAAAALLERAADRGRSQPRMAAAKPLGTPLRLRAGEAASRALPDSAAVGPRLAAVFRRISSAGSRQASVPVIRSRRKEVSPM
jgi:[lysine-biosynthesis-protein LysW]---L-2-aminoadipate ligase